VSLQVAILKVLSGHPGGRASVAAINADLAILNGFNDFTERMKRLAAIAPDIDIFRQRLVMRDDGGWQITDAGREFLRLIEPR
jgi:hypothetical protein